MASWHEPPLDTEALDAWLTGHYAQDLWAHQRDQDDDLDEICRDELGWEEE